jgi:hypothetical protein
MLSDEDVKAQQQLVSDLTLKVLLPHIDKRVRALNQQVKKENNPFMGVSRAFMAWAAPRALTREGDAM